ncbi:MAG: DUF3052 domain-containing protein [Parvularculaceae bacterium]
MKRAAPAPVHGYSGKPLFQKIGLKPGMTCLALNAPASYDALMAGAEDVAFRKRAAGGDVVHLFCANRAKLAAAIPGALDKVAPGGALWISWPKKSSPLHVDLTEDDLRATLLPLGWGDVKVCAVDADWSGLKFVRRKT